MRNIWVVLLVCMMSVHLAAVSSSDLRVTDGYGTITHLQDITDKLRDRMEILDRVIVTVVDHNPLVMSVETLGGRSGPFVITADRAFIRSLNAEELNAALAHELGHVWIYTHHPYLQTERLANEIALRVISAEVFVPVYEKVWKRLGIRGNLADYISLPQ